MAFHANDREVQAMSASVSVGPRIFVKSFYKHKATVSCCRLVAGHGTCLASHQRWIDSGVTAPPEHHAPCWSQVEGHHLEPSPRLFEGELATNQALLSNPTCLPVIPRTSVSVVTVMQPIMPVRPLASELVGARKCHPLGHCAYDTFGRGGGLLGKAEVCRLLVACCHWGCAAVEFKATVWCRHPSMAVAGSCCILLWHLLSVAAG